MTEHVISNSYVIFILRLLCRREKNLQEIRMRFHFSASAYSHFLCVTQANIGCVRLKHKSIFLHDVIYISISERAKTLNV